MLTARLLRKGTQSRSADQIAAAVDFVGGSLDAGAAQEYAFGTAEFLKQDLDLAVDLLSDTLIHPSFPADELDKMIKQEVDGIKDDKTVPGQVIDRYYEAFLLRHASLWAHPRRHGSLAPPHYPGTSAGFPRESLRAKPTRFGGGRRLLDIHA